MFKADKLKRKFKQIHLLRVIIIILAPLLLISIISLAFVSRNYFLANKTLTMQNTDLALMLEEVETEIETLKNTDQIKRNDDLEDEIANIQQGYAKAVSVYESLLDLQAKTNDTKELDAQFAQSLSFLSLRNYQEANTQLNELTSAIAAKDQAIASAFIIPESAPVTPDPPGSGYSRQSVPTAIGNYLVSLVAADIASTKVIVDTASSGDCGNDCPVLPLAEYVARSGAYAGINGTYFCPADYPSCAGKTNSFDLLVMNKDKTYFNSDNNVYSSNPGAIFGSGYIRFVSSISQWGRDTSVDGVISNYPLLVANSANIFAGDDDPKKGSKAGRSFVANKGNSVYIGVVHNATVAEAATVLTAMGMENAMNLDSGGSTALYSGGYKVGPGRSLPNVLLFVSK